MFVPVVHGSVILIPQPGVYPQMNMEQVPAPALPCTAALASVNEPEPPRSSSPEYFKANKRGVNLNSGQQQIILNVYSYLRKKRPPMRTTEAAVMAGEMCGVGTQAVLKARRTIKEGRQLMTPTRKRSTFERTAVNIILDDGTKSAVRRKVHECLILKKENITLNVLKEKIDADSSLPKMSRSTIRNCLKSVGFYWFDKKGSGITRMQEREDIIFWRRNYLRQIRQRRLQDKCVIYLDETWLSAVRSATSKAPKTARQLFIEGLIHGNGSDIPPGKGGRSIVMHPGSKDGSTEGVQLAFLAKREHTNKQEVNGDTFRIWVEEELLPNIPGNSVIVMGNASYHSSQTESLPEKNAKKITMQHWLTKKNIPWTSEMSRAELYTILQAHKQKAKYYIIDHWLQKSGYEVLRQPPYHCELNPIELAWGKVKSEIPITSVTLKAQEEQEKLKAAIAAITPQNWKNWMDRVMKTEESYCLADSLQGEHQTLGIRLDEISGAEETDEDDDMEDTD